MPCWLDVSHDAQGCVTTSKFVGEYWEALPPSMIAWAAVCALVVPGGPMSLQDMTSCGWIKVWGRPGKSVWRAKEPFQALSNLWCLNETRAIGSGKERS